MSNSDSSNIRQRKSIRPSSRPHTSDGNDSSFEAQPPVNANNKNQNVPVPYGNSPLSSATNSVPRISHSQKASEAEKLLESNANLVKLQNSLNLLDVFINNRHMEMLSPASGLSVPYTNEVQELPTSLKDTTGICVYCIDKIMLNPDESTYEKLVSFYSAMSGLGGVFAIILQSDGKHTKYYMCVHVNGRNWADNAGEMLSSNFKGQFPGSSVYKLDDNAKLKLLRSFGAEKKTNETVVKALSMIPGRRQVEVDNNSSVSSQGLEKFIDTMEAYEYTLVILNQRIQNDAMDQCKSGYEMMYTLLSSFSKENVSYSESDSTSRSISISDTFSESVNDSISSSFGTSRTDSSSSGSNKGRNYQSTGWFGFEYTNSDGSNSSTSKSDSSNESTQKGKTTGTSTSTANSEQSGSTSGTNKTVTISRDNKAVLDMMNLLDEHIKRIDQNHVFGMWNSCCYVVADAKVSSMAVSTLSSLLAGDDTVVPHAYYNSWDIRNVQERNKVLDYLQFLSHPNIELDVNDGQSVQLLTPAMLVSGREIPILCSIPSRSVSGIVVTNMADFGRNIPEEWRKKVKRPFVAGKVYHMGKVERTDVEFDLDVLSSHCFICGASGSGKSNTTYNLIKQLISNRVPFLVIEPAKGEYKDEFMDIASIYSPFPQFETGESLLSINPFYFPKKIHVQEHIDRLIEIFNACWPMYAAMPAVLKAAIEQAYINAGWQLKSSTFIESKRIFPNFNDVLNALPAVISDAFSDDTKGDYKGALITRIESLTRGINGMIFGASEEETISDSGLFDENAIVDLSPIGSTETRSLIMGMLILKLHEYRMSQRRDENTTTNNRLRHITVLEEAHNILRRTNMEQAQEGSNLQGKAVEMIVNSIAEMRTYGEAFVIADQSPGLLDKAVIRNTNTKIIMRLPDAEDREVVGRSAGLNDSQIIELSKLEDHVAVIYQNDWIEPVLCQVSKVDKSDEAEHAKKKSKISKKSFNPAQVVISHLLGDTSEKLDGNHLEKINSWIFNLKLDDYVKSIIRSGMEKGISDEERQFALYCLAEGKTAITNVVGADNCDSETRRKRLISHISNKLDITDFDIARKAACEICIYASNMLMEQNESIRAEIRRIAGIQ